MGEVFTRDRTKESESIRCQHLPRDHRLLATDTDLLVSLLVSLFVSILVSLLASLLVSLLVNLLVSLLVSLI